MTLRNGRIEVRPNNASALIDLVSSNLIIITYARWMSSHVFIRRVHSSTFQRTARWNTFVRLILMEISLIFLLVRVPLRSTCRTAPFSRSRTRFPTDRATFSQLKGIHLQNRMKKVWVTLKRAVSTRSMGSRYSGGCCARKINGRTYQRSLNCSPGPPLRDS